DAERVVPAMAATLGVREQPGRDIGSSLSDFLRPKRLLLVIDNFERVLEAAPRLSGLLEECEGLRLLVTSRAALRLRGEREVTVPPLDLPVPTSISERPSEAQVRELAQSAAIALFVERAAQARPDFALSRDNARDVALICARLDGLPLAIELAAARVKILSPSAIRSHLENQLPLPGRGPQDAPLRHQTLRAAIDWSYDLLAPALQAVFRRLMVFEGGCSPETARAVAATDELGLEAWDALERLCGKSLLRHAQQSDGSTWFFALETLRQYGREKLEHCGELEAVQKRHAAHYLGLVEAAEKILTRAPEAAPLPGLPSLEASQALWREWREREHLNLRAALNWFLEHGGDQPSAEVPPHGALRMAFALRRVWVGDLWTERREALERALEVSPDAPDDMRLLGMLFAGDLAVLQADTRRAAEFGQQSLTLSQKVGSRWAEARALSILANVALENGDFAQARALHEQSLIIHREMGNDSSVPWVLYFLGNVAKRSGDEAASRDYFAQSLAEFRKIEEAEGIATALYQLSVAIYRRDDPAPSRALLEESLAIFRELGHQSGTAWALGFLGRMAGDEEIREQRVSGDEERDEDATPRPRGAAPSRAGQDVCPGPERGGEREQVDEGPDVDHAASEAVHDPAQVHPARHGTEPRAALDQARRQLVDLADQEEDEQA
ncbi:MAG: tetratricopeptide repeat protein, partial [Armatimonadetes bacterium]|nr:tetratricopeptide repeat protein [Armatimonadota bacterium]